MPSPDLLPPVVVHEHDGLPRGVHLARDGLLIALVHMHLQAHQRKLQLNTLTGRIQGLTHHQDVLRLFCLRDVGYPNAQRSECCAKPL